MKSIFEPIKNLFLRSKFLSQKLRWKNFLEIWKIELAENAEYDSGWCADYGKQLLSLFKNYFLTSKFFRQKLKWKKSL